MDITPAQYAWFFYAGEITMRIQTLVLKDFRRFENLQVDFHLDDGDLGGLTVFVAKNGEGKTSILDAINISWGTFIGVMPNSVGESLKKTDQRTEYVDGEIRPCGVPEISATFVDGPFQPPVTIRRSFTRSKKRVSTTTKDAKPLANYAIQLLESSRDDVEWPIIAYYGDNRLWAGERLTNQRVFNTLAMGREFGYSDATNPKSGYKEFSLWFPSLELAVFVEEQRRASKDAGFDEERLLRYRSQLAPIKEALRKSLKPAGWDEVVTDVTHGVWAINAEHKSKILIDSLSAGVKIIIGLVGDIAFRCVKLNPRLGSDALTKTPGVVLIDEIELHLHPEWQQVILPTLRSVFPRIQFIVTTHSPQVITSVPKECVRILEEGRVDNPSFQTQGVESQEALLGVFGVDPAPDSDAHVIRLNEYEQMARSGNADSELGRRLYRSLQEHYGKDYPPLERIEINRKYRKNNVAAEKDNA